MKVEVGWVFLIVILIVGCLLSIFFFSEFLSLYEVVKGIGSTKNLTGICHRLLEFNACEQAKYECANSEEPTFRCLSKLIVSNTDCAEECVL